MSQDTRCRHGNIICEHCAHVTDAAKRFSDAINLIITVHKAWEIKTAWIAVKLEDGSCNATLYDTRAAAITHQSDERLYCYFPIGNFMNGLTPLDAQLILTLQRHAYDQGFRITDEKTPDLIPSVSLVDMVRAYQRGRSARVN
jgi:hypothetical protein